MSPALPMDPLKLASAPPLISLLLRMNPPASALAPVLTVPLLVSMPANRT